MCEEAAPFLVLREEGGVEHVGVGEEDASVLADVMSVCEGGIAVVCLGREGGRMGRQYSYGKRNEDKKGGRRKEYTYTRVYMHKHKEWKAEGRRVGRRG